MRLIAGLLAGIAGLTITVVSQTTAPERFAMRVVATGLAGPWEVTWGPDKQLWVTERVGKHVLRIDPASGTSKAVVTIPDVHQSVSQDGLLGLALHPDFSLNMGTDFVYVAYTYDADSGAALARRLGIRRYRFDTPSATLVEPTEILRDLPSHDDHVGGRLAIGPDRRLYVTIGDGGANFGQNRCMANRAQDLPTAADVKAANWGAYFGKVLRLELNGAIPANNPLLEGVRSHIFSYGHRNPLGLAFGPGGALYESEHGPSSDDEVNLIQLGRNYGWPRVAGYRDDKAYVYSNWSASTEPCAGLPGRGAPPPSVPSQVETSWNHPQFTPPLQTFFTVDALEKFPGGGNPTMAPGGLDVYTHEAIPRWKNSVLALSLIRGVVYRLPLAPDGRAVNGPITELFRSLNRYRDIALGPDGRTFYLITDPAGSVRDASGVNTQVLANPGSLLEYRFTAVP